MSDALQFLISGLAVGSINGLIGVGFTRIYNVIGIVNFAQGDFAMGAMSAIAFQGAGVPMWLAIISAILITCAVAVLIARSRPCQSRLRRLAGWRSSIVAPRARHRCFAIRPRLGGTPKRLSPTDAASTLETLKTCSWLLIEEAHLRTVAGAHRANQQNRFCSYRLALAQILEERGRAALACGNS